MIRLRDVLPLFGFYKGFVVIVGKGCAVISHRDHQSLILSANCGSICKRVRVLSDFFFGSGVKA